MFYLQMSWKLKELTLISSDNLTLLNLKFIVGPSGNRVIIIPSLWRCNWINILGFGFKLTFMFQNLVTWLLAVFINDNKSWIISLDGFGYHFTNSNILSIEVISVRQYSWQLSTQFVSLKWDLQLGGSDQNFRISILFVIFIIVLVTILLFVFIDLNFILVCRILQFFEILLVVGLICELVLFVLGLVFVLLVIFGFIRDFFLFFSCRARKMFANLVRVYVKLKLRVVLQVLDERFVDNTTILYGFWYLFRFVFVLELGLLLQL